MTEFKLLKRKVRGRLNTGMLSFRASLKSLFVYRNFLRLWFFLPLEDRSQVPDRFC